PDPGLTPAGRPAEGPEVRTSEGPEEPSCTLAPRMDLVRGPEALPLADGPSAVTVGFFDGVHLGHQAVIGSTVEAARARGLRPVAVTFDRHPREIYAAGTEPPLLTTLERKAALIEDLGIETLLVLAFDLGLSRWPPAAFAERVLAQGW